MLLMLAAIHLEASTDDAARHSALESEHQRGHPILPYLRVAESGGLSQLVGGRR